MNQLYLYLNGVLYIGLAAFCSLRHEATARGIGFRELNNGGHSEYLVIYGGLQLGLGAFFAYCAANPEHQRLGLMMALMLYVPIVAYRVFTILVYRPVGVVTLGTGGIEAVMLAGAAALLLVHHPAG